MSYHNGHREYQRQEAFALRVQKRIATLDEGRGMENIPNCPTCARPTLLIEHDYQPQLRLIADGEPEREGVYFTCEWCNSEIDPRDVSERAPRKPASNAGWEDETERARRMA